jgi:hypothetical protein
MFNNIEKKTAERKFSKIDGGGCPTFRHTFLFCLKYLADESRIAPFSFQLAFATYLSERNLSFKKNGACVVLSILFRRVQQIAKRDYQPCHVCRPVRPEQLPLYGFLWNLILIFSFSKLFVEKIQV